MTILELFRERCSTRHNIDQHLPLLLAYARQCDHITELGTDTGFSTTAFLAAQPAELHCYDIERQPDVDRLSDLAGKTRFVFHQEDSLTATIAETDLLFIDTEHTYEQVKGELERHGHKARKLLIFHDIVSYPEIIPAIQEYVQAHPDWWCVEWRTEQSGLAVFRRGSTDPGG